MGDRSALRVALLSLLFAAGCATGKSVGADAAAGRAAAGTRQGGGAGDRRCARGRDRRRRQAAGAAAAAAAAGSGGTRRRRRRQRRRARRRAEPAARRRRVGGTGGGGGRREPAERGRERRRRGAVAPGTAAAAALDRRARLELDGRRRHRPEPGGRRSRQRAGHDDRRHHAAVPQPEAVARQRDGAAVHADQRRALDGAARRAAAHDHHRLPEPVPREHLRRDAFTPRWATRSPRWRSPPARADYVSAQTEVGEAGQPISVIQKGATDTGTTGRAYAASLFEVAAIARLAKAQGKSYGVGAILLNHGESDAASTTLRERHGGALDAATTRTCRR